MSNKRFAGVIINESLKNPDGTRYISEPLGLEHVLAIAKSNGYETKLFDNLMYPTRKDLGQAITEYHPNMTGFSVFDNSRNNSLKLAEEIKQRTGSTILFGGYHPTACPEIVLYDQIDYVFTGNAEESLNRFLQTESESKRANIPNVASNSQDRVKLDRQPLSQWRSVRPTRSDFYLRQKDYALNYPAPSDQTGVAQIMINWGCLYNCIFCSSPTTAGRKVVRGKLEDAIDEIADLKEKGVNLLSINDLNVTYDSNFIQSFSERLKESGLSKNLYLDMFGNVSTTTPEIIKSLHDAGMRKIGYGIESLNSSNQKYIGKKIDIERLKSLLDEGDKVGILTSGFYQIGFPTDSEASIREDFRKMQELELFFPRIRISIATPTSGSRWYNQIKEENPDWPKEEDWPKFDTQHLVYTHPNFEPGKLKKLRNEMENDYYESDFYQKTLGKFLKKHSHLEKASVECGWKIK